MAITFFDSGCTRTNTHEHEGISNAGSFTGIQTSVTRPGSNGTAVQLDTSAGGNCIWRMPKINTTTNQYGSGGSSNYNATDLWLTFYFRVDTLPSVTQGNTDIAFVKDINGVYQTALGIKSDGKLIFKNADGTTAHTGSSTLSTATWYRIDVHFQKGLTASMEAKLNGAVELSGTVVGSVENIVEIELGFDAVLANGSVNYYYSDYVVDDAAYFSGDPRVFMHLPISDGDTFDWPDGTGTDYTVIDEAPANDADYIQSDNVAGDKIALCNLQSMATVGASGYTPKAVRTWIRVRENSGVTSSTKVALRTNSNNYLTSGVNHSTTVSNRYKHDLVNPNTSAAWTASEIDALQVGVCESNAVAVRCTTVGAIVLYDGTPPASGGNPGFFWW